MPIAAVIVALGMASVWRPIEWWSGGPWQLAIEHGQFRVVRWHDDVSGAGSGFTLPTQLPVYLDWSASMKRNTLFNSLDIPAWLVAIVPIGFSIFAFGHDSLARRRATLNLCPTCHYNRAGLPPQTPCPECGTPSSITSHNHRS
jgi:hypothetical protein